MLRFVMWLWALVGVMGACAGAWGEEAAKQRVYLIGNSLTWDTVPGRLDGDVQWHVDCGVNLRHIHSHPEMPCVRDSTRWPEALRDKQYDVVSVQPHYGTSLADDVEVISAWMTMQPKAVFVIHSGWAFQAQRASEFDTYQPPQQMTHSPVYLRALVAELRRRHPGREIRQTFAQTLLAQVADDVAAGRAPFRDVADLYRDVIHVTNDHGKYLMHNAMRRALGQPHSSAGFDQLDPKIKDYLDGVLRWLDSTPSDQATLAQILADCDSVDRTALVTQLADARLREQMTTLLPAIEAGRKNRAATLALQTEVAEAGGTLVQTPSGPPWLYLATHDAGAELLDVPTTIDLYNGNNPLKGKGGRNERVNDDWLKRLANATTLRKLDLANCAIQGEGLRHLARLTRLRELNLTLTPISDDGLRHLAELTDLRSLGLASTQCTGVGFQHLQRLQKLDSVNFHFTPLNDAGLQAISQIPNSGRFWFAHTKFTDAGAASLRHLTQLKRCGIGSTDPASSGAAVAFLVNSPIEDLSLLDNQATPEGLAHAARITTLRKLDLSHAPTVTDESLPAIAALPKIEEFRLGSAGITNEGLQKLATSTSLKKISLSGLKQVTMDGIEQLRKAKPGLVVTVE